MFNKHVIRDLTAYEHGECSPAERIRVESHLRDCPKCRTAYEDVKFAARMASMLSVAPAPPIELAPSGPSRKGSPLRRRFVRLAPVAALAILVIAVLVWKRLPSGPSWEMTGVEGRQQLRPGDVLDIEGRPAEIKIADIGYMTVAPNSRIRLLTTREDQHRVALDRGRLEATTWAPPRLFVVETPLADAVDLGCRYSLEVEDDGSSLLHVTLGLVALERDDRETIVPAGAFCRTRRGAGPGTPYFEDSSTDFQTALAAVDSSTESSARTSQLEIVLREARIRDGLSLWHLLSRLDGRSRALIYDRLAELLPPPPGVTREGIVALDPQMLEAWKKIVSQLWQ